MMENGGGECWKNGKFQCELTGIAYSTQSLHLVLGPGALGVRQKPDKFLPSPGNRNVLGMCTNPRILHLLNSGIGLGGSWLLQAEMSPRTRAGAKNKSTELTQPFQLQEAIAFLDHHL